MVPLMSGHAKKFELSDAHATRKAMEDSSIEDVEQHKAEETAPSRGAGEDIIGSRDVFAFGLLTWMVLHKSTRPYRRSILVEEGVFAASIAGGVRPKVDAAQASPSERALMEQCWASTPESRPDILQVLQTVKSWPSLR